MTPLWRTMCRRRHRCEPFTGRPRDGRPGSWSWLWLATTPSEVPGYDLVRFLAYEANSNELIREIMVVKALHLIWQAQLALERFGDGTVEHNLVGVVEMDVLDVEAS